MAKNSCVAHTGKGYRISGPSKATTASLANFAASAGRRKETDKLLLKTAKRGEGRELLCAEIPIDYGAERRRRW